MREVAEALVKSAIAIEDTIDSCSRTMYEKNEPQGFGLGKTERLNIAC